MINTYINLLRPQDSNIKFEILRFPDGQQDVRIEKGIYTDLSTVKIKSRFNSFLDYEVIACTVAALRNLGAGSIILYIPYLLGARSDRKFVEGGTIYLKQIIAPLLNLLKVDKIECLDVHNELAATYAIDNLICYSNSSLVGHVIGKTKKTVIISPDEGAHKKIYSLIKELQLNCELVCCSKKRDLATGDIIDTSIGNMVDFKGNDVYIIDDICDGGRTFIEIAKKVKLLNPGKLYLIVTHGIFSKGLEELGIYFDKIYCTNSYSDYEGEELIKVIKLM